MDRFATLRTAARVLRAAIFRSLPWGVRVAHLFVVLASGTTYAFGRAFFDLARKRGVVGLEKADSRKFGSDVYRAMFAKYRDDELVEDSMVDVLMNFTSRPDLIEDGTTVPQLFGLVRAAVNNQILTRLRSKARERKKHKSLFDTDEEGEATFDILDPEALDRYRDVELDLPRIRREVGRILTWAPDYVDMVLEGHGDAEIIGDPAKGRSSLLAEKLRLDPPYLTNPSGQPMTVGMWSKPGGYKDKIRQVMREHVKTT